MSFSLRTFFGFEQCVKLKFVQHFMAQSASPYGVDFKSKSKPSIKNMRRSKLKPSVNNQVKVRLV